MHLIFTQEEGAENTEDICLFSVVEGGKCCPHGLKEYPRYYGGRKHGGHLVSSTACRVYFMKDYCV